MGCYVIVSTFENILFFYCRSEKFIVLLASSSFCSMKIALGNVQIPIMKANILSRFASISCGILAVFSSALASNIVGDVVITPDATTTPPQSGNLTVNGEVDILGNVLDLGSAGSSSNPGVVFTYTDDPTGNATKLTLGGYRNAITWKWQQNSSSGTKNKMTLDQNNKLSLYDLNGVAKIVFDPSTAQVSINDQPVLQPNSSGNIGLGTTTTPQARLDILNATGNQLRLDSGTPYRYMNIRVSPSTGAITFSNTGNLFAISETGDVRGRTVSGIDPANFSNDHIVLRPDQKFIGVMSNFQYAWRSVSTGNFFSSGSVDTGLARYGAGVIAATNGATGSGSFRGNTFTATAANGVSTFAGSVGLGTVTPTEKLEVVGNIKVSGVITCAPGGDIPMYSGN